MFGDFRNRCDRDPDLQAEAATSFQVLVDALTMLQAAGAVRADNVMVQAQYVWAIVHGIAMLAIDGQLGAPEAATLDPLIDLAMRRLRSGIATARASAR